MDHQSSIRSFFRPTSTPQPNGQHTQPPPVSPGVAPPPQQPQSKYLPPPPPVIKPSSYALPPSSTSSPKPPTPTPSFSNPQQPPSQSQTQPRNPLLPHQANISPIQPTHIPSLKRINALLLPIAYPDSFYTNITDPTYSQSQFSRVIEWDGKVVGGIICRVDEVEFSRPGWAKDCRDDDMQREGKEIYIQSLALLSPFRGKGLAGFALEEIIRLATSATQSLYLSSNLNSNTDTNENGNENENRNTIKGLYAHVWTQNTEALEWYSKKGFVLATPERDAGSGVGIGGVIPGYYRKLRPDTAFLLRRELGVKDYISSQNTTVPVPVTISTISQTREVQIQPKGGLKKEEVRPPLGMQTRSFQDRGPEREWNDLPVDVVSGSGSGNGNGLLGVKGNGGSTGSSSRASSRGGESGSGNGKGGKKKRVYPAAAFAG